MAEQIKLDGLSVAEMKELQKTLKKQIVQKGKAEKQLEANRHKADQLIKDIKVLSGINLSIDEPVALDEALQSATWQLKEALKNLTGKRGGRVAGTIKAGRGENREKVLAYFGKHKGKDVSPKDIAEGSKVAATVLSALLKKLVEEKVIVKSGQGAYKMK